MLADAAAVEVALDPIRASILDALTEPGSAATVAAAVGSTRQKVNYHLKALEAHGLVEWAGERAWGGIAERIVRRSAPPVVAPDVAGAAIDPKWVADRLGCVSDWWALGPCRGRGDRQQRRLERLSTLTVDTVIGFRSPEDRAALATDLQSAVAHWLPDTTTTTGDRTV